MVPADLFIVVIIIGIVQFIKIVAPGIAGALTIIVAIVVGIVVSLIAPYIGVEGTSIAGGILAGLASVGIHTTAAAVNTKTT